MGGRSPGAMTLSGEAEVWCSDTVTGGRSTGAMTVRGGRRTGSQTCPIAMYILCMSNSNDESLLKAKW